MKIKQANLTPAIISQRIAVIGADGYLGKHTVKELRSRGHEDTLLISRKPPDTLYSEKHLSWNVTTPHEALAEELSTCDCAVFLAGLTGTTNAFDHYAEFIETNEIGLLNLLDLIRENNLNTKVIFPSSRLMYKGKKDALLREEDQKESKTIYAANKNSCEAYLRIYNECFSIPYTVFRICVPYGDTIGKGFSYGSMQHFIGRAINGEDINVYGDGLQKRTFTHISDLTRILISAGLSRKTDNQAYNLGGPDHLSISEVALKVAQKYGVGVNYTEWDTLALKTESGDTMFDSSKLDAIISPHYQHTFDNWLYNKIESPEKQINTFRL